MLFYNCTVSFEATHNAYLCSRGLFVPLYSASCITRISSHCLRTSQSNYHLNLKYLLKPEANYKALFA